MSHQKIVTHEIREVTSKTPPTDLELKIDPKYEVKEVTFVSSNGKHTVVSAPSMAELLNKLENLQ